MNNDNLYLGIFNDTIHNFPNVFISFSIRSEKLGTFQRN